MLKLKLDHQNEITRLIRDVSHILSAEPCICYQPLLLKSQSLKLARSRYHHQIFLSILF